MRMQDTRIGITPFAYESVTVPFSAIGLTAGTYAGAVEAIMTLETGQIRIRVDGTNPSSSEGHLVNPGDIITLVGTKQIAQFRGFRTGGVSGVLKVTYLH